MTLEENLEIISNALWCFDFEHIQPPEEDKQKNYLYALSSLFKKNKRMTTSKNIIERFKARKNLTNLVALWNKTIETGVAKLGRVHDSVVINKVTLPQSEQLNKIIAYAKHEREKQLEEELSKKIDDVQTKRTLTEMEIVFVQKDFKGLTPISTDEKNCYLYAFYLLTQKNKQALNSSEKVERLQAKKNINTLVSLWNKTVSTYSTIHQNLRRTIVVVENVYLPEKQHYQKFVDTALSWKSKNDEAQIAKAKAIREGK